MNLHQKNQQVNGAIKKMVNGPPLEWSQEIQIKTDNIAFKWQFLQCSEFFTFHSSV